jgi:hypothetical protein
MDSERRFNELVEEALAQSFSGWDFSFVDGRIEEQEPSWSYPNLAGRRIARASALVDLCTGGGEFLNQFYPLPKKTYATEGYTPNVKVAKDRLEPRGVTVVPVESDDRLPLPDNTFDLIINRHGAYSAKEMVRISNSLGSVFLTQQVGSNNAIGLNTALFAPTEAPAWNLSLATAGLIEQGFVIANEKEEHPAMSFKDIGAVVFYLKAIPWQIPGFEFSQYRRKLLDLHEHIELHGSFDVSAHRFLIEAKIR